MNKYNIQIPTVSFGLIGVEIEGTVESAVQLHNELIEAYRASQSESGTVEGLSAKDNNFVYDKYLNTGTFDPEMQDLYFKMNKKQQGEIQALKRAFSRAEAKESREIDYGGGPGKGENGNWENQD